jgi:hypothetical protein
MSSRHLPARGRVHPGSRGPTARRHSVTVGRCLPAGPSLPPGARGSPPGRVFGSRAWWSPPRQPGGPHCRPMRYGSCKLTVEARCREIRIRRASCHASVLGDGSNPVGSAETTSSMTRPMRSVGRVLIPPPCFPAPLGPSPSPPAWLRSASYRSLVGARGTRVPAHRKVGAEALPWRVCQHPSSNRYQSPECPAEHSGEESHAVTGRLATQAAASFDCAPRDYSDEARFRGGRSRASPQLGLQAASG